MNIRVSDGTETIKTFTVKLPEGEMEIVEIPDAFKSKYQKSKKTIFALPQALSRFNNKLGRPDMIASRPFISEDDLRDLCYNKGFIFREGTRLVHTKVEAVVNDDKHMDFVITTIKQLMALGVTSHVELANKLNLAGIPTKRNKQWTRSNLAEFTRRYI
jgi:hypothetical protein